MTKRLEDGKKDVYCLNWSSDAMSITLAIARCCASERDKGEAEEFQAVWNLYNRL